MSEFAQLLDHLHRGGTYANWWKSDPNETIWFPVAERAECPNGPGRNTYFSVHPLRAIPTTSADGKPRAPKDVRGRNEYVEAVNALYAEFDLAEGESKGTLLARVRAIQPAPSAIIDSGHGYQAYWLLLETFAIAGADDLAAIDRVQKAWVGYVGSDPGAKDLARVLRVPGTMNVKSEPHMPVEFVEFDGAVYDLDYLQSLITLPPVTSTIPFKPTPGGHVGLVQLAADLRRVGAEPGEIATMLRALADSRENERAKTDAEIRSIASWSAANIKPAPAGAVPGQLTWAEQAETLHGIEWLWDKWLPRGFITLIVGAVEVGKSLLTLSIANSILTGTPWPDNSPSPAAAGRVIWFDTEASEVMNIARAKAMGVPMERIVSPTVEGLTDLDLWDEAGGAAFDALCRQPDIAAIVVDSLGGAHVKENDDSVKVLVHRLARLAKETHVPVLLVHHPRKLAIGEQEGEITLDRVRGFSGIIQFCRVIWAIERPDAFNEDMRRLRVIKSNLGAKPEPLGFSITEDGLIAFTKDAPERLEPGTQLGEAEKFIREHIKPPTFECSAGSIFAAAEARGINQKTLKRAKKSLGVGSKKVGAEWLWTLPKP